MAIIPQRAPLSSPNISTNSIIETRVFIQGVEVSAWVQNINVCYAPGDVGNCSIQLGNDNLIWILSKDNLIEDKWRNFVDDINSSEVPKKTLYEYKRDNNSIDTKTGSRRWILSTNTCVVHKHDTIRVFARVPWLGHRGSTPSANDRGRVWFPLFSGYVNCVNAEISDNPGPLTLNCYDIRAILQKQRLIQNPFPQRFVGSNTVQEQEINTDGFFADLIPPIDQAFSSILVNLDPLGVIRTMLLGKFNDINGNPVPSPYLRKVGNINEEIDILEPTFGDDLSEWNTKCLLGDLQNLMTYQDVTQIGQTSDWAGANSPHGENVRIRFLKPLNTFGFKTLEDFEAAPSISEAAQEQIDWASRLDIIEGYLTKLDYKFWVSPAGDLIFEYPFYDQYPGNFRDWQPTFNILKSDGPMNFTYNEDGNEVKTLVVVQGGVEGANHLPGSNVLSKTSRIIIKFPSLIMKYGVLPDDLSLPTIYDCNVLAAFGMIHLQKSIATAFTYDLDEIPFRLLLPNRPIYAEHIDIFACTNSVAHTFNFESGSSQTKLEIGAIRTRKADGTYANILDIPEQVDEAGNVTSSGIPFAWGQAFNASIVGEVATGGICGEEAKTPSVKTNSRDLADILNSQVTRSISPSDYVQPFPQYTPYPVNQFPTGMRDQVADALVNDLGFDPNDPTTQSAIDAMAMSAGVLSGGNTGWANFNPDTGEVMGTGIGPTGMTDAIARQVVADRGLSGNVTNTSAYLDQNVDLLKNANKYTPEDGLRLQREAIDKAIAENDIRVGSPAYQASGNQLLSFLATSGKDLKDVDPFAQSCQYIAGPEATKEACDKVGYKAPEGVDQTVWKSKLASELKLRTEDTNQQYAISSLLGSS